MDTIQFLLKALFKLIIVFVLAWFVLWIITILYPNLSIKNVASYSSKGWGGALGGNWLPAPGSVGGFLSKGKVPDENTNVYKPASPYNGYANAYNNNYGGAAVDYITYTSTGTQVIRMGGQPVAQTNTTATNIQNTQNIQIANNTATNPQPQPLNPITQRSFYVRNLSIYEGGHIYSGISFVGEARSTMFKDGKFPIIIVDNKGKVVTVAPGEATANWSVPGWVKFKAKIPGALPDKIPCTMVFQSANAAASQKPPYVAIPVICN